MNKATCIFMSIMMTLVLFFVTSFSAMAGGTVAKMAIIEKSLEKLILTRHD